MTRTPNDLATFDDLQSFIDDHADNGCSLHGACLSCPFERCRYDEPGGLQAVRRRERDAEMRALAGSMSKDALADRFGLGLRHVYKVLAVKV